MGIRKFLKKQFEVKQWFGVDSLKQSTRVTKSLIKSFVNVNKKQGDTYKADTFQDCINHYQLTPDDLRKKQQLSMCLVYIYLGCSIGLFLYVFCQFWASHIWGGLMSLVMSAVLFLYGFKEYTTYYQIKHQVLKFKVRDCLKEFIFHLR